MSAPVYRMETSTSRCVWVGRQIHDGGTCLLVYRDAPVPQTDRGIPCNGPNEHFMKPLTLSALIVIASAAASSAALAQDVAAGKTSFNKCLACHAVGEGARNKVGPVLNG